MKVINMEISKKIENQLKYVVIVAKFKEKFVFVRHKNRETWEIPGGHIEESEGIIEAAKRELYEETGALNFELFEICDYGVERDAKISYGRLFYAEVSELGELPNSEIGEIKLCYTISNWTYEKIQPILFDLVDKWIGEKND